MSIRSFVLRQGRMTQGQERAFDQYWQTFGLEVVEGLQVSSEAVFGNARPLVLEIGFGNGESFIEMACAEPEKNFIGLEVHRPGVGHALLQAVAKECGNVRFICHDAVAVLQSYVPNGALSRVQIYFPDPWPKLRHHKRRLIQPAFVQLLYQRLAVAGELHLATDWEPYALWMREVMQEAGDKWQNLGEADGFALRPSFRPKTKFELRGERKGHGVWDLRYAKQVAL